MGIVTKLMGLGLAAAVGAAFATKPSIEEVRDLIRDQIAERIEDGSITSADNAATQALLAACQISPGNCARVLEGAISLEYENRFLYAQIEASAPGLGTKTCYAAFDRLICT